MRGKAKCDGSVSGGFDSLVGWVTPLLNEGVEAASE